MAECVQQKAERELRELSEHPNMVFKLVKSMKKDVKNVEIGRCMRGSEGRLSFSEKSLERTHGKNNE